MTYFDLCSGGLSGFYEVRQGNHSDSFLCVTC
ncbi:Uncharacterised protein [Klebsiella pneumoniae]|nr:Uncharacterised protein [Klebsiella pneumoniae]